MIITVHLDMCMNSVYGRYWSIDGQMQIPCYKYVVFPMMCFYTYKIRFASVNLIVYHGYYKCKCENFEYLSHTNH